VVSERIPPATAPAGDALAVEEVVLVTADRSLKPYDVELLDARD
jgi:hypothetical protein